jgi:hypothetical protein
MAGIGPSRLIAALQFFGVEGSPSGDVFGAYDISSYRPSVKLKR